MHEILDEIDKKLLGRCSEYPGSTLAGLFTPLQEEISPRPSARTMYHRLGQLEVRGFIEVDRKARRGRALAKITGKGRAAIEGWEDIPSTREGSA
jgi:DNA-binding PadR family transcriptional regulator